MRFPRWGLKRADTRGQEVSPGGSAIHRYETVEQPKIGFVDGDVEAYVKQREAVYVDTFGEIETVNHEVVPLVPHVDVYVHRRTSETYGPFYVLVTGGMSDLRMTVQRGQDPRHARAELVLYVREPTDSHFDLLRFLAHFPHDNRTLLGVGHTLPNGQPAEPLFASSALDTVLLLPPLIRQDDAISQRLCIEGDAVNMLWVVPITTPECNYKLRFGYDKFLEVLDKVKHPFLLNEQRRSYL